VCMVVWAIFKIVRSTAAGIPGGWRGSFDLLGSVVLFGAGLYAIRGQSGAARTVIAAALVLFAGIEYKVMGTSKRFDAAPGPGPQYSGASYFAMDATAYKYLREHATDRIMVDQTGPLPSRLRHVGLLTPQGFDPFLSIRLRDLMKTIAHFRTPRDFEID